MRSSEESTARPWKDEDGFRETFLYHFTIPRHRAIPRRLGRMLYEWAFELKRLWPDPPGRSLTEADVRAAVAELRYMEGFLRKVAEGRELFALDAADERLSRLAGREAA